MRVGLTYDLKDDYLARGYDTETCAEFDAPETIDAIEEFLKSRGCETQRIGNIQSLVKALAAGRRWDLVFNIAEGLHGNAREAQVPALLDAYQIPYVFSDAMTLALTLDKALTKTLVKAAGIPTAEFFVTTDGAHQPATLAFPLFVKPIAEGTGKGITAQSLVHSEKELRATVQDIQFRFCQNALVERYLCGCEFTVGIVGTGKSARILGVMEILLQATADPQGYTFDNKLHYESRVRYRLADDIEARQAGDVALRAWRLLNCRDGGRVDIRSDENRTPHFLEVNPLAGLHPVLGDLVILSKLVGLNYHDLLGRILDSALSDTSRFASLVPPSLNAYA